MVSPGPSVSCAHPCSSHSPAVESRRLSILLYKEMLGLLLGEGCASALEDDLPPDTWTLIDSLASRSTPIDQIPTSSYTTSPGIIFSSLSCRWNGNCSWMLRSGVEGAMAGSQCTNTTQMQIQTCTFVLYRQLSCTLGLSQREGKGKMHEQLAIIALLSQDDEHIQ